MRPVLAATTLRHAVTIHHGAITTLPLVMVLLVTIAAQLAILQPGILSVVLLVTGATVPLATALLAMVRVATVPLAMARVAMALLVTTVSHVRAIHQVSGVLVGSGKSVVVAVGVNRGVHGGVVAVVQAAMVRTVTLLVNGVLVHAIHQISGVLMGNGKSVVVVTGVRHTPHGGAVKKG